MSHPEFATLLDGLYAGVLDPLRWADSLTALADVCGGSASHLVAINPVTQQVLRDEGHRMDAALVRDYRNYWSLKDVLVEPALRVPAGLPMPDQGLMPIAEFRRSEIYNDFMLPQDVPHLLVTWLHKSPRLMVALSVKGTTKHGAFGGGDVASLKPYIPHLTRALEMRARLEKAQTQLTTLRQTLGRKDAAFMVLDEAGRVLEASERALALTRTPSGIRVLADGTLALRGAAGRQLRRWLGGRLAGGRLAGGVLRLDSPRGACLSAILAPIPVGAIAWTGGTPCWTLSFFDPAARPGLALEWIGEVFGLTPRETQVVALLTEGHDTQAVSVRLGISIHTTRSLLKTAFRKTGTHSQGALVAKVLSVPALPDSVQDPPNRW